MKTEHEVSGTGSVPVVRIRGREQTHFPKRRIHFLEDTKQSSTFTHFSCYS